MGWPHSGALSSLLYGVCSYSNSKRIKVQHLLRLEWLPFWGFRIFPASLLTFSQGSCCNRIIDVQIQNNPCLSLACMCMDTHLTFALLAVNTVSYHLTICLSYAVLNNLNCVCSFNFNQGFDELLALAEQGDHRYSIPIWNTLQYLLNTYFTILWHCSKVDMLVQLIQFWIFLFFLFFL